MMIALLLAQGTQRPRAKAPTASQRLRRGAGGLAHDHIIV
jgi:hypothetical protein